MRSKQLKDTSELICISSALNKQPYGGAGGERGEVGAANNYNNPNATSVSNTHNSNYKKSRVPNANGHAVMSPTEAIGLKN